MSDHALVLFSGGQDSTTCLLWALDRFDRVETVGFDYGQRHKVELECRANLRSELRRAKPAWAETLGEDHTLDLGVLGSISETSLTRKTAISLAENGLPTTFVPGRNLAFITFAAALAYRRGIKRLVTGVCETDYSGYPDCRDDTMKALQVTLNLGMAERFVIHTPLMWIDKAATWELAEQIGGRAVVELLRTSTHTCYMGDRSTLHAWGYGCGSCPACDLRAKGWETYRLRRVDSQLRTATS